ncbi:MAG: ABC transporter ATP-binding protein [Rhodobacteraceae bacterium]|nr:ABC transporter ATP-binding protein [Paracoccaceae bacterium]MCY4195574.1 ABC transporter ATP-binding protein [Paracoccaceae bacterium]
MTLLSTRQLSKSFGGLQALRNVDFDLERGRIRALIGPNGAGKSTFVGAVCGRFRVTSGNVIFNGNDITRLPAHHRIGLGIAYSFQITSVFDRLTVHENVALGVRRHLKANQERVNKQVCAALDKTGLRNRADQLAGDLSYGHQRLLEIAMGLGQNPQLFIMDEPTQGLAESEVDAFQDLLQTLCQETTILLIEHNMKVVMDCADDITVLNFGEVLAEGPPAKIQKNEKVQHAYFGTQT